MSKYSVKKPLTIFMAVLVVLVLGFVSYTKMTPDLLPNMEFPYVVIMTTYPGASPEKVESEITRPMEQSMATLSNIQDIKSTSSENYSTLILQFSEDVNMDSLSVDIMQKTEQLRGSWNDSIGSPYILKINPSMMAVTVAAVSHEGMDNAELSAFVNDELLPKLEGVAGVASITTTGMVEKTMNVVISEKKIAALNDKIQDAIDVQFDKKMKETKSPDGSAGMTESEMKDKLEELKDSKASMEELQKQVSDLEDAVSALETAVPALEELQPMITQLNQAEAGMEAQLAAIQKNPALDAAAKTAQKEAIQSSEAYLQMTASIQQIDEQLKEMDGITRENFDEKLNEMQDSLKQAQDGLASIDKELQGQKLSREMLSDTVSQMEDGITQLESGIDQVKEARKQAHEQVNASDIITMDTISKLLTAQNFAMPAGYVEQDGVSYLVSAGDEITSEEDLKNLTLFDFQMDGLKPVTLQDVADVFFLDNSDSVYANINGENGIMFSFTKQSSYATAKVCDNIEAKFTELEGQYEGLQFENLMNQGSYISMVIRSILENLFFGALFAILVLFLFLQDLRPTFITLCSIPFSVVFAFVLMYFSGVTLNMISMSGLAIAVGMLVDNSVVVIENIYRLKNKGVSTIKAAVHGASQVAGAIAASTLTTICVFVPIVFTEGLTRQLFSDMALTIAYALLASLIVALTLVPAMASGILRNVKPKNHRIFNFFMKGYRAFLSGCLHVKFLVLLVAAGALAASIYFSLQKGFILMPNMDSTQLSLNVTLPEDMEFKDQTAVIDQVIDRAMKVDGIETIGAMSSQNSSGMMSMMGSMGGGSASGISMYAMLSEDNKRSNDEVCNEIIEKCSDLNCEITGGSAVDFTSYLGGSGVSIYVYGEDLDQLQEAAAGIAEKISGVEGVEEVSDGMEETNPEIHFAIDREKAMSYGLTVAQVYMQLTTALTDSAASTSVNFDGYTYDISVTSDASPELTADYIKNYSFETTLTDGTVKNVAMKDLADIEDGQTLSSISRENQRRYLNVTASVDASHNVTLVSTAVEEALKDYTLPDGVTIEFSGENESIMESMMEMVKMLLLGIFLVYMIMVCQFQSLKSPFIIMFTIPLAMTGGLLALLITGQEVSVIAMLGFVMLCGIIVNNGIVLVDYINQLRREGMDRREAILEAGVTRMRPILMTSLTTILGLVMMIFSGGEGAAMMKPIATVCIGGLIYATLLTLVVIPVLYDLMNHKPLRVVKDVDLILSEEEDDGSEA